MTAIYVLHDVVSLLHSIVCSVHNNISPITANFAYQICVGKLMPVSAMFVNYNVILITINDNDMLSYSLTTMMCSLTKE